MTALQPRRAGQEPDRQPAGRLMPVTGTVSDTLAHEDDKEEDIPPHPDLTVSSSLGTKAKDNCDQGKEGRI